MSAEQRAKLKADAAALMLEADGMETSAGCIQGIVHGREARQQVRVLQRDSAAQQLQGGARGYKSRGEATTMFDAEQRTRDGAARSINAGVRGKLGRSEALKRNEAESEKERKRAVAAEARRRRQDQAEEYVRMQAEAKAEAAVRKKRKSDARVVQSIVRGREGRSTAAALRREWDAESAQVIQTAVRVRQGKNTVAGLQQQEEDVPEPYRGSSEVERGAARQRSDWERMRHSKKQCENDRLSGRSTFVC